MKPMPPDDDGDDTTPSVSVGDPVLGKSRLLSRQCATCIFKPGNPMHLREGRLKDLVDDTRARESYIVCHSTLPHFKYPEAKPAICRGFADRYSTQALQLIERLWGFVEVDPPGETPELPADDSRREPPSPYLARPPGQSTCAPPTSSPPNSHQPPKRIEVPTTMASIDDFVRRQTKLIDSRGWAVTIVLPTEDGSVAPFAYTVGLTAVGSAELIIAGLDPDIAQELLDDLAHRVHDQAQRFTSGQHITDLLAGYDAVIVEGPATEALHPGAAIARYGMDRVRLQQVVWPDPHGRFPWEPGCTTRPETQPTLGRP